jgi:hypothetical protein
MVTVVLIGGFGIKYDALYHQPRCGPRVLDRHVENARTAALAKKTGRTKSCYAREAIVEYIDDLEYLYLA